MKRQVFLHDGLVIELVGPVVGDDPARPTQAPRLRRSSGSNAVTNPPGLRFQVVLPSGSRSRSTGSRLATTTKSESPERFFFGCFRAPASARSHLCLVFRRPNTEHGQENAALVGVDRIRGDNAPGLARGAVCQRFHVANFAMCQVWSALPILGDAPIAAARPFR